MGRVMIVRLRDIRRKDYESGAPKTTIFTTYKRQQTMLEKQKRLNVLPEMQSKVTTYCDNSSVTEYKTWGLGGYIL